MADEERSERGGDRPREGGGGRYGGPRPGGDDRGEGRGGEGRGGGMRRGRPGGRRKVCRFCADKTLKVDYKDVRTLQSFITEGGKIVPSRTSGMPNVERSLATRKAPCTDTPTPPPMVMPSSRAT